MKILFLTPNQQSKWNNGHDLFRQRIGKMHEIKYCGPGFDGYNVGPFNARAAEMMYKPEFIMTYGMKYTWQFHSLKECIMPTVHFLCDYIPAIPNTDFKGYVTQYDSLLARDDYDLIFCLTRRAMQACKDSGVKAKFEYLPFGIDPMIFQPLVDVEQTYDVGTMFHHHIVYPNRKEIEGALMGSGLRILKENRYLGDYVYAINQCKVMVISLNYWKSFGSRILEAMACGTMVITERPEDYRSMGLVNERNIVYYGDTTDMLEKVNYFIQHEDERQAIAAAARELVLKRHTNEHRVKEMTAKLQRFV